MARSLSGLFSLLLAILALVQQSTAARMIESKSLNPCMDNSGLTASLFNVLFTPDDGNVALKINGVSTISGNVTVELRVLAYGINIMTQNLIPCNEGKDFAGLCPMKTGGLELETSFPVDKDVVSQIPGIAFTIPDLDGKVQVYINRTDTREALACVEADLSNGKTVYQKSVGWVTAIIAGSGLLASAITSGLGHSNTAAHVAANAMSLFSFFQTQAYYGMTAVDLPPIVAAWTQNFQWSMGIIRVGFLQRLCTWYQRATGGTPSSYLTGLSNISVSVQKRSLQIARRSFEHLLNSRSNNQITNTELTKAITIHGIERVGFRAKIEMTNIFMTGYCLFIIFVILVVIGVGLFKLACEGLVKAGKLKGDQFQEFRNGWSTVLKGIMFRIVLIGFPQMVVLCFWELTRRDSPGEVVLAVFTLVTMLCILGWAASKVVRIAQRSITLHKNPAYILYSDPSSLNKWGFLYVQFKAAAYYFIIPVLAYTMIKGMFIALAQKNGTVQAVALVLIEGGVLVAICVMRPYMDKKTNGFNIAICVINFLSAIFLLIFSNVFNQPAVVSGAVGVVFFFANAIFALVLLLMVLVSSVMAVTSKNPDNRYQPMRDDRGSFIKSNAQLTTELDALGATARGEGKNRSALDDDEVSVSSFPNKEINGLSMPTNTNTTASDPYRNPVDPSVPLFPSGGFDNNRGPPSYRSNTSSPAPNQFNQHNHNTSSNNNNNSSGFYAPQPRRMDTFRQQNNSSPWQRGAGYEH